MRKPTLSILLPTIGRSMLTRMLQSIREQDLGPGDEILLVSDDRHETVAHIWTMAGLPGRHIPLPDGPHRDWGHTPRNLALTLARADFVLHVDDDDVLLPGALARIHAALRSHPNDFHVFPFIRHRDHRLIGSERTLALEHIGTPNLVHPTGGPVGRWGTTRGGDAAFITGTVALNPDRTIHWHTEPHYYAEPPEDYTLTDCYAAGYRIARTHQAGFRLLPTKSVWVDLAHRGGTVGREDCQWGWHALAARLFAGCDILDVGAGLAYSRSRLAPAARRLRLQDPGIGLPVDLACSVSELPTGDAEIVTAFDVFEHVEDDRGFIENLLRIATNAVFLTTPNWLVSHAANPHHCREYTPSQLLALLDGLPVAGLWVGDPSGAAAKSVDRAEFARHTEPHQAVLLRR